MRVTRFNPSWVSVTTLSESVKNKAELLTEHSKNDYHERSKQVPKDWHSGDFDVKWQEKELHKQRQKCFKAFG